MAQREVGVEEVRLLLEVEKAAGNVYQSAMMPDPTGLALVTAVARMYEDLYRLKKFREHEADMRVRREREAHHGQS